jgi:hypothetical protein
MSQASSTGLGDDLQATMEAILQRLDKLDTIEERIDALEAKFPELQPLQDQVVLLSGGGGDDTTTPIIGAISAESSLDASDVLVTIGADAIDAIWGGGSVAIGDGDSVAIGGGNLVADALRVGDDDGTDVLLGNRTMVILAGDNLGGVAV